MKVPKPMPIMLAIALVGGCGGGAESDTNGNNDLTIKGLARFTSQLKDDTGGNLANANVTLPVNNKVYGATTNSEGYYDFTVPASEFSGIEPVAMLVSKNGYRPRAYYYKTLIAGEKYILDTADSKNSIVKLVDGEFVPNDGYALWHLGDETFGGASNSQLQVASIGLYKGMKVGTVDLNASAKYKKLTLSFQARGIDTNRDGSACKNRAGVFQVDGNNNLIYSQEAQLGNSPADGSFGNASFIFSMENLIPGKDLYAFINSAACTNGDKGDDFEFTQVLLKFE